MKTNVWQGIILGKAYTAYVEEHATHLKLTLEQTTLEEGLKDLFKGALSFARAHPILTGFLANRALNAFLSYKKASQQAMTLYAPTPADRPVYFKMVDMMKKQGWKVVKTRYIAGSGYEWTLSR